MKIHWGRILWGAFIFEIIGLVVIVGFLKLYGMGTLTKIVMVIGCFIIMVLAALWIGRKIESRFILHGFLASVVAIILYVLISLRDVLTGNYPMDYWEAAILGHIPKIIGGILGGYLAGKIKNKNA